MKMIRFRSPDGQIRDSGMCEPSLNLLAHAQAIELEIGSRCGGHGECGGDRVQIQGTPKENISPVTADERRHLTPQELFEGWRLACQCFPEQRDLECEVIIPSGAASPPPQVRGDASP
jgi:ferredoxin